MRRPSFILGGFSESLIDERAPNWFLIENLGVWQFYLPKEGGMTTENDASRVSIESAGGLVFSFG